MAPEAEDLGEGTWSGDLGGGLRDLLEGRQGTWGWGFCGTCDRRGAEEREGTWGWSGKPVAGRLERGSLQDPRLGGA